MNAGGIDVNAFPPELPPEPAGDDLEPEQAPQPPEPAAEGDGAETPPAAETAQAVEDDWPPCDYCNGRASLAIVYRQTGEREFSCFPCHGAVIARALNEAADQEAAATA